MRFKYQAQGAVHIRRCHMCNGVTEQTDKAVQHCESCGKAMAPFYFFEDREVEAYTTSELRPPRQAGAHPPLRGLTAYW